MSNRNICRAVQIQLVQVNDHMAALSIRTLGKSTTVTVRKARQTVRQGAVSTDLIHGLFANAPAHHRSSAIIIPTVITGMAVRVMRKIITITITVDIITVQHTTITKLVITFANATMMIITTIGHLSRVTIKETINLIIVIEEMFI